MATTSDIRKGICIKFNNDIFKIRGKRSKILVKKRGTGIPTLKGAVCSTSKDKDYLLKLTLHLCMQNATLCTKSNFESFLLSLWY